LSKCIITKFHNQNGFYQFRLCLRGKWTNIHVDDYLPCNILKKPIFAKIKRQQLYAALIEKALAKSYGSYESISNGTTAEGLQILTGEPCEVIHLKETSTELEYFSYDYYEKSPELYWQKILDSKRLGYLMTCICSSRKLKIDILKFIGKILLN
jgi:hypothetical protein